MRAEVPDPPVVPAPAPRQGATQLTAIGASGPSAGAAAHHPDGGPFDPIKSRAVHDKCFLQGLTCQSRHRQAVSRRSCIIVYAWMHSNTGKIRRVGCFPHLSRGSFERAE